MPHDRRGTMCPLWKGARRTSSSSGLCTGPCTGTAMPSRLALSSRMNAGRRHEQFSAGQTMINLIFSPSYWENTVYWAFYFIFLCCYELAYLRLVAQLPQSANLSPKSLMLNPKLLGPENERLRNWPPSGRQEPFMPLHILA